MASSFVTSSFVTNTRLLVTSTETANSEAGDSIPNIAMH